MNKIPSNAVKGQMGLQKTGNLFFGGNGMGHQKTGDLFFDKQVAAARAAVKLALSTVEDARQACLRAGQLLCELKASPYVEHGDFQKLIGQILPEISYETARTWMRAAESVFKRLPAPPAIEVESEVLSVSALLSLPEKDLPAKAIEWRQQWLDFVGDKTLKECISGVVVDGDPAHRIERALNGKLKGGHKGEDRKDWPKFISAHLGDITTHLDKWDDFTAHQVETTGKRFRDAFKAWPTGALEMVSQGLKEELKKR